MNATLDLAPHYCFSWDQTARLEVGNLQTMAPALKSNRLPQESVHPTRDEWHAIPCRRRDLHPRRMAR